MAPSIRIHAHTNRRAGLTLLELVFAVGLMGVMLLSVSLAAKTASDAFEDGRTSHVLASDAHRTLERIAEQVAGARLESLTPDPSTVWGTDTLDFQHSAGLDGDEVAWTAVRRIQFEYEAGELDDGLDNNGNGLVDEGVVVWTEDVGEDEQRRTVLCHGVAEFLEGETANVADDNGNGLQDERGVSFALADDVLTVRLSLQRVGRTGEVKTKTVETSVLLRN